MEMIQLQKLEKNDSVIFFNFRPDRAREITRALVDPEFNEFETKKDLNLYYVCFTSYDETMPNVHIAFKKEPLKNTFGEYISEKDIHNLELQKQKNMHMLHSSLMEEKKKTI